MNFLKFFVVLVLGGIIFFPHPAHAVIPPDFIFTIGSSIVQVFSVIFLFFSAVIGVSYRYLKVRFAKVFASKLFWVVSIVVLIIGSGVGAFMYASQKQRADLMAWVQKYQLQHLSTTSTEQYYYYDRLLGQGEIEGSPFVIRFEGSRQQVQPIYGHYYSIEMFYKGKVYKDYVVFNHSSSDLVPYGFVKQADHIKPAEFPDEGYRCQFSIDGVVVDVVASHLRADFLVKNDLTYLRYVSAGEAEITIGGKKTTISLMADRILSTDGRVPMVAGYSDLKYISHSIVLWDESHNFYHLDISDVITPNVPYTSHSWILYKGADGFTKKLSEGTIELASFTSSQAAWRATVVGLGNARFNLRVPVFFDRSANSFSGLIEGEIQDDRGVRKVQGYGFYDNRK